MSLQRSPGMKKQRLQSFFKIDWYCYVRIVMQLGDEINICISPGHNLFNNFNELDNKLENELIMLFRKYFGPVVRSSFTLQGRRSGVSTRAEPFSY